MMSPSGSARWRATEQLLALLSAGDFDGDDSRRLTAALGPAALLLRAVVRLARAERATARADVRAAIALAPRDGFVRLVASRLFHVLRDYRSALAAAAAAADLGVSAAALLRYEQARAMGWYHHARAVLEELVRATAAPPADAPGAEAPAKKLHERAIGHLLQLFFDVHHYEAAARLVDDFFPALHASPHLSLQAAQVYERCERPDKALAAIRNAIAADGSPPVWLQAAKLLLEIGAFEEARALYEQMLQRDSRSMPALEALGRLCLWRGDVAAAGRYADDLQALDARNTTARRIRAAVRVLDGDAAGALPEIDTVLNDDPHDAEAYLWRAEARLRLGRFEDAQADCDRAGYTFVARVIRLLATLQQGRAGADSAGAWVRAAVDVFGRPLSRAVSSVALGRDRTRRRWWRSQSDAAEAKPSPAHAQDADAPPPARPIAPPIWQELSAELEAIDADASALFADGRSEDLIDLLDRALRAMRGNRTALATRVRDDGTLTLLPRSVSARAAARYAMELIKIASPEEALASLDALAQRFPDSAMPLVHRGELHLWLGRYADARRDLQGAIAMQRQTRWAWYGLASLDLLEGDPERALATCAEGIRVMHNSEGPVAFLYRGEAYRCLGRLDEARDQLLRSCELHPTRLSAWINLALVHGAAADTLRQREVFARIARAAPSLLSEATQELGDDVFTAIVLGRPADAPESGAHLDGARLDRVLRHCLEMMRGNRSSSCVTYFTGDGALHYVPQRHDGAPVVQPAAEAREIAEIRQLVLRALQSR